MKPSILLLSVLKEVTTKDRHINLSSSFWQTILSQFLKLNFYLPYTIQTWSKLIMNFVAKMMWFYLKLIGFQQKNWENWLLTSRISWLNHNQVNMCLFIRFMKNLKPILRNLKKMLRKPTFKRMLNHTINNDK